MLPHFIESLAEALFKGAMTLKDTGNGARRPGDVPEAGAVSRPSMLPRFIEFLADTLFKGAITLKDTGNGARRPGDVPEAGRTQTRRALVRVI